MNDIPAGRDGAGNTGDTKSGKKVAFRRAGHTTCGRTVQNESTRRICWVTYGLLVGAGGDFFQKRIDLKSTHSVSIDVDRIYRIRIFQISLLSEVLIV